MYVFRCVLARTNIDEELIERVMRIYRLSSKREAVDPTPRRQPMSREEAFEGTGWGGDLAEIRRSDDIPEL